MHVYNYTLYEHCQKKKHLCNNSRGVCGHKNSSINTRNLKPVLLYIGHGVLTAQTEVETKGKDQGQRQTGVETNGKDESQ